LRRAVLRARLAARAACDASPKISPHAVHLPCAATDCARRGDDIATGEAIGMTSDPMVKAEAVHKRFGRLEVLRGIDLEVAPKEGLCLPGPSGSGKSTFLRCINHLE